MTSTYNMPVETILKVDENELLIGENQKTQQPKPLSSNFVSIGTQCDWKIESSETKSCSLLSVGEKNEERITDIGPDSILISDKTDDEVSMVIRRWPSHSDSSVSSDQKLIPPTFSQEFSCNIQALPIDEQFFLQFDYKTRNKLKTKQRRLDPCYRTQERVRQRTVMRIKRQDPRFRAAEREKGRYRMRLKRLDPVFRSQERERQRERMKIKRSDPGFRKKEREQQKTRLHVKRLDPEFKEKERAQDRLRMHIKRQNNDLYSTIHPDENKSNVRNANIRLVAENQTFKSNAVSCDNPIEMRNTQAVFPENISTRLLSIKPRESTIEAFHFKKQHILNFNFYNSSKEQWAAHDELCSKTIAHFSVMEENEIIKSSPIQEDTINILQRDQSEIPKKKFIKHDLKPKSLIDIKSEELSFINTHKEESSTNCDASAVHRFSMAPCAAFFAKVSEAISTM